MTMAERAIAIVPSVRSLRLIAGRLDGRATSAASAWQVDPRRRLGHRLIASSAKVLNKSRHPVATVSVAINGCQRTSPITVRKSDGSTARVDDALSDGALTRAARSPLRRRKRALFSAV